jgi:hypothetical protein
MNWMAKVRPGSSPAPATTAHGKPGPLASQTPAANLRVSNGLKEFLWLISEVRHGRILDLGQVSQATLNFFIEKGYRVTTEDVLRTWTGFVAEQEEQFRGAPIGGDGYRISQAELAEKFLETTVQYPNESFHGILAWDLFDYFDAEVLPRVMARLFRLLHPGGAVLALFHSRPAERFHRYRVVDGQTIELLPASTLAVHARVFRNREILDLFSEFRTSKTFVGRDQVREALFLK